jgi:hypothetical protein
VAVFVQLNGLETKQIMKTKMYFQFTLCSIQTGPQKQGCTMRDEKGSSPAWHLF